MSNTGDRAVVIACLCAASFLAGGELLNKKEYLRPKVCPQVAGHSVISSYIRADGEQYCNYLQRHGYGMTVKGKKI